MALALGGIATRKVSGVDKGRQLGVIRRHSCFLRSRLAGCRNKNQPEMAGPDKQGCSVLHSSAMGTTGFWSDIAAGRQDGLPLVMGILNATPDSFFASSKALGDEVVAAARRLIDGGAVILDIGGESTRPGAEYVPVDEELRRVVPVVSAVRADGSLRQVPISIDTRKLAVLEKALEAGADILNDISALQDDPDIAGFVVANAVPTVLMHKQGEPRTMQRSPEYADVVEDVCTWLEGRALALLDRGYPAGNLLVDPGFGFGKNFEHNVAIFRALPSIIQRFARLGVGVLVGFSRKNFIGGILSGDPAKPLPADERLFGTVGACIKAAEAGAAVLRVHDAGAVSDALRVWAALGT